MTLAESQSKKAAFLREAVRVLGLGTEVYGGRAEAMTAKFDAVAMRAVDKMVVAVPSAIGRLKLGPPAMLLMIGAAEAGGLEAMRGLTWAEPLRLPGQERVILAGNGGALGSERIVPRGTLLIRSRIPECSTWNIHKNSRRFPPTRIWLESDLRRENVATVQAHGVRSTPDVR